MVDIHYNAALTDVTHCANIPHTATPGRLSGNTLHRLSSDLARRFPSPVPKSTLIGSYLGISDLQNTEKPNFANLFPTGQISLHVLLSDMHEAFFVEIEALAIPAEARRSPRPSELDTETRPKRRVWRDA